MQIKNKRILFLIISSLLITLFGCVSTKLLQPLPLGSRIGVCSNLAHKAIFRHSVYSPDEDTAPQVATESPGYNYALPGLNINFYVFKKVRHLLEHANYSVINITKIPPYNIFDSMGDVSANGAAYLGSLKNKYHLGYLLLINPRKVDFADSNTKGMLISGYGVFYRTMGKATGVHAVGGYTIILIDLNTNSVLNQQHGKIEASLISDVGYIVDLDKNNKLVYYKVGSIPKYQVSGKWPSSPKKISKSDLKAMITTLQEKLPKSIADKVNSMMF